MTRAVWMERQLAERQPAPRPEMSPPVQDEIGRLRTAISFEAAFAKGESSRCHQRPRLEHQHCLNTGNCGQSHSTSPAGYPPRDEPPHWLKQVVWLAN